MKYHSLYETFEANETVYVNESFPKRVFNDDNKSVSVHPDDSNIEVKRDKFIDIQKYLIENTFTTHAKDIKEKTSAKERKLLENIFDKGVTQINLSDMYILKGIVDKISNQTVALETSNQPQEKKKGFSLPLFKGKPKETTEVLPALPEPTKPQTKKDVFYFIKELTEIVFYIEKDKTLTNIQKAEILAEIKKKVDGLLKEYTQAAKREITFIETESQISEDKEI